MQRNHRLAITQLRLVMLLAVVLMPQLFAKAAAPLADESEPATRGYWFYLTTPGAVERPLIGICSLVWWKNGKVEGNVRFDTHDSTDLKRFSLECMISGDNAETGKLNVILYAAVPRTNDEPTRGAKLMEGSLTKTAEGGRITWAGPIRLTDKTAFSSRIGVDGLKRLGLSAIPAQWDLAMIGFKHLNVTLGEVGLYQTQAEAKWLPERDKEARQWLSKNGIDFEKRDYETEKWFLELPPFNQNLIVYRMLRSGIFDEVARSAIGAGPGETYSVSCPQSSIFSHPPESAEGVAEGLAFTRKFVADVAEMPRFRGVRFGDPVVVRTHRLRFSLIGPSSVISNGPQGYWEHNVMELSFYREFGQLDDAMTLDLSIARMERAKGPASVEPPLERFDPESDSSSKILTSLGTELGSRVKATRQGLTNAD